MKQKIYQGFKKVIKPLGKGLDVLNSYIEDRLEYTLENLLKHIPNYAQKRDETLENCLYKILEGEKLSFGEQLKVGFQAPSVKSAFVVFPLLGIGFANCVSTQDPSLLYPSYGLAGWMSLFPVAHDGAMGQKLERIVDSLTKEEKEILKEYLNDKKIDEIRERLYHHGW